jgi:AraC-like DNA-binding protein
LTRRLSDEGTSIRLLHDELRRDLAFAYLRDPAIALEELARRIGFADARAFRRAFQRWTSRTPAAHRARLPRPDE